MYSMPEILVQAGRNESNSDLVNPFSRARSATQGAPEREPRTLNKEPAVSYSRPSIFIIPWLLLDVTISIGWRTSS